MILTICILLATLLLFGILLSGRLSPKACIYFGLILWSFVGVPHFLFFHSFPKKIPAGEQTPNNFTTPVENIDNAAPKKKKEASNNSSSTPEQQLKIEKPTAHNFPHSAVESFSITGEVHEEYITLLEEITGITYKKKGQLMIEITHEGRLNTDSDENQRVFQYSGGAFKILINQEVCCCGDVYIPKRTYRHKNLKKANEALQKDIIKIITSHKAIIATQLHTCIKRQF